ncbi:glycosyltransferase family 9 protein [Alphaproteobacteria bacterium]|nr:glycosyltransferase family 9 protein [Alphaproteobacteria bacterium]
MKVLFIGNTRLGDAILSTPIISYYNKKNNHITVICSSLSANIYASFSSVIKVIILKKKKRGLHWLEAYGRLEKGKWDLVIDLRNSILSRLIRKKSIIRFNNVNNNIHKVKSYCNLLNLQRSHAPTIPSNQNNKKFIKKIIKKYKIQTPILAIAPITNWKRKNWPLENYKILIKELLVKEKKNFSSVILLGSDNENIYCEKLRKSLRNRNIFNFAGSLKILEIYELLKFCKLYVGNDSGLTHLAAASNIKTLALFGPSKNEVYRPWGKNSYFIRTPESYSQLVEVKGYNRFEESSLLKTLKVKKVLDFCLKII